MYGNDMQPNEKQIEYMSVCFLGKMCVCVCAHARAHVCVCVCVCVHLVRQQLRVILIVLDVIVDVIAGFC